MPDSVTATDEPNGDTSGQGWLLLIYRVPSEPTRLRAAVWRRIKSLGAIYLQHGPKSSMYHREIRGDVRGQVRIASLLHNAGRWPRGQPKLVRIFQAWPAVIQFIAALTRLRPAAIHHVLATL